MSFVLICTSYLPFPHLYFPTTYSLSIGWFILLFFEKFDLVRRLNWFGFKENKACSRIIKYRDLWQLYILSRTGKR